MKAESKLNGNMNYKTVIHRFEYSVLYKLKDKGRIENAMKMQDEIRKKTKGGISLTKEIRKWRETRCS
jgi:hypothetical protein